MKIKTISKSKTQSKITTKPKAITETLVGTIRIKTRDLNFYEKTKTGWKKIPGIETAKHAVDLFVANDSLDQIIDKKNPEFLKGLLSPEQKIQGARLNILPNGEKLDKAYSLFSKNLTFHDQTSHGHFDVLFENTGGTYAYLYTLDKIQESKKEKYKKVAEFSKRYPELTKKVTASLKKKNDIFAMPMYTLLKTYMRIGNEIYFKTHGHKGLTTLKKSDVKIDGAKVTFSFIAKDGVPQKITKEFPKTYITRLTTHLKELKNDSFIFTHHSGSLFHENHFKQAFLEYCGHEFYPHIVRSHFATNRVETFLKENKTPDKKQAIVLFKEIAGELGHKKFNKKTNEWVESYNVTISHYIKPELVEKIKLITKLK